MTLVYANKTKLPLNNESIFVNIHKNIWIIIKVFFFIK